MKQLSDAIRLWPHPDEAPEVPPETVLRRFLSDPGALDADLAEQIRSSPNCARVLESLRRQSGTAHRAENKGFFDQLRRITAESGRKRAVSETAALGAATHRMIRRLFGTVWTTHTTVELWTGRRVARRFTFRPLTVVIVREAREMPWDDTLYRAIPLTPAFVWPDEWLANDELRLILPGVDRFAAHLWLEYPVSGCQLDRCIGQFPASECENLQVGLAAFREGLPLPPEEGGGLALDPERDTEILLERERLHACAAWLAATADARREWGESRPELLRIPTRTQLEWISRMEQHAALAAAATGPPPTEEYTVGIPGVWLQVAVTMDRQYVGFQVFDKAGNPSHNLDDATITTAWGNSEPLAHGQTKLPADWVVDGFRIRLRDGTYLKLRRRKRKR